MRGEGAHALARLLSKQWGAGLQSSRSQGPATVGAAGRYNFCTDHKAVTQSQSAPRSSGDSTWHGVVLPHPPPVNSYTLPLIRILTCDGCCCDGDDGGDGDGVLNDADLSQSEMRMMN